MPRPAELGARASRASREKGGPWDVRAMLLPYFEIVIALAENLPYMVAGTVVVAAVAKKGARALGAGGSPM